jgi:hypothetical protein
VTRIRANAAVAIVAAAIVAGCAGTGDDISKLRVQAHAALDRWAAAVVAAGGPASVVPVGELTGQVGDWEVTAGDNKASLMSGLVEAATTLSDAIPPDADVTWPDGSTTTVHLISAVEAVAAIQAGNSGPCGGCPTLRVTDAHLTTGPITTTRGPAMAPVWEFTVDGTAVKVTRVAIGKPITVVPPPWDANHPPEGVRIDSASGSITGTELTVSFTGAPDPGDRPCGEDYTTEAVESDLAVVVIVVRHPHGSIFGESCLAVGATRVAAVTLAKPLGDRAVLEVQEGTPVPVTLTP